jgi:hypothetical protein
MFRKRSGSKKSSSSGAGSIVLSDAESDASSPRPADLSPPGTTKETKEILAAIALSGVSITSAARGIAEAPQTASNPAVAFLSTLLPACLNTYSVLETIDVKKELFQLRQENILLVDHIQEKQASAKKINCTLPSHLQAEVAAFEITSRQLNTSTHTLISFASAFISAVDNFTEILTGDFIGRKPVCSLIASLAFSYSYIHMTHKLQRTMSQLENANNKLMEMEREIWLALQNHSTLQLKR